jgi:hypothetical protein
MGVGTWGGSSIASAGAVLGMVNSSRNLARLRGVGGSGGSPPEKPPKKKNRIGWILFSIVLFLVIISLIVLWVRQ